MARLPSESEIRSLCMKCQLDLKRIDNNTDGARGIWSLMEVRRLNIRAARPTPNVRTANGEYLGKGSTNKLREMICIAVLVRGRKADPRWSIHPDIARVAA